MATNCTLTANVPIEMAEAIDAFGQGNRSLGLRTLLNDPRVVEVIREMVPKYTTAELARTFSVYWGERGTGYCSPGWNASHGHAARSGAQEVARKWARTHDYRIYATDHPLWRALEPKPDTGVMSGEKIPE